jgi:hypothetical protein
MVRTIRNGVGVLNIISFGVWAFWILEHKPACDFIRVGMSLDDFDALGIHEYQRLQLKLPRHEAQSLYFRSRDERPPFVRLEFGRDVRRYMTWQRAQGNGDRDRLRSYCDLSH